MEKKHTHGVILKIGTVAGELDRKAARKQLYESLTPLQWLASKNGFGNVAKLIEEALNELTVK